jgi:predicted permease
MPSPASLSRIRDAVVVLEIALAVVLLIGGALLGRSLMNLMQSGTGAAHQQAVTAKLNLADEMPGGGNAVIDRLLADLASQPGVAAAGVASSLPPDISQMRTSLTATDAAGRTEDVPVEIVAASGGVFSALGVPLLEGRTFTEADAADAAAVVILSKTASKKFFQDRQAVGAELSVFGGKGQASRVIGIVDDVKFAGMEAPSAAALYVPHAQRRFRTQYVVVRANTPSETTVAVIRKVARGVDGTLATSDIRTVAELTTAAMGRPRFQTALLVLFALTALLLAGIGLYGVVTQSVNDRTREFAVRLSLGAVPSSLFRMVMRRALGLAGIGAAIGLAAGVAVSQTLAAFLFGVDRLDAVSFAIAIAIAVAGATIAAMGPAVRVSRLHPASTLRSS